MRQKSVPGKEPACPIASLASSGMRFLSSFFARSWSKKALRVLRKQRRELRPGIGRAHVDNTDCLDARVWRLCIDQVGGSADRTQRQNFFSAETSTLR